MTVLYLCSGCCIVLSIWAIVQLIVMGICYKIEATLLIEDAEPHGHTYADYDDFIKITKENFSSLAINCWIVAALYMVTLVLSCFGLRLAKKRQKIEAVRREDDEYSCAPKDKIY